MEEFDCKKCLHEKVCALWASRESQNASCFCTDGCDYFTPTLAQPNEWVSAEESSYFCFDANPHWQWDGLVQAEQKTLFWMPLPEPPGKEG